LAFLILVLRFAFRPAIEPLAVNSLHLNLGADSMRRLRSKRMEDLAGWSALIAAFTICLSIVLLSWPVTNDTKYASVPAGCCEVGAGKVVLVSGSPDDVNR
jgi:hypothetical protein